MRLAKMTGAFSRICYRTTARMSDNYCGAGHHERNFKNRFALPDLGAIL
jgi:hypothetical protein